MLGWAGVLVGCLLGCASTGPAGPEPMTAGDGAAAIGDVMFVNEELGYVIVQGRNLPTKPERAKVLRSGLVVGSVRFDGTPQPPFASADVVDGQIQSGDRVVR